MRRAVHVASRSGARAEKTISPAWGARGGGRRAGGAGKAPMATVVKTERKTRPAPAPGPGPGPGPGPEPKPGPAKKKARTTNDYVLFNFHSSDEENCRIVTIKLNELMPPIAAVVESVLKDSPIGSLISTWMVDLTNPDSGLNEEIKTLICVDVETAMNDLDEGDDNPEEELEQARETAYEAFFDAMNDVDGESDLFVGRPISFVLQFNVFV
jgi:hypothetical protein